MQRIKRIIAFFIPELLIVLISKLDPQNLCFKNFFWNFTFYLKKNIYKEKLKFKSKTKFGIVVQGPMIEKDDFTYKTLKDLKDSYPNNEIVLSTWNDQNKEKINKIKELGIYVIENDYPKNGMENINYQIYSTLSGIKYLKNLKVSYVMKLRTDQKICKRNVDIFLFNLIKTFKVIDSKNIQKERIIGINMNTIKYRPFSFSDLFQFGNIEDMEKMWDIPLTTELFTSNDRKKLNCSVEEMEKFPNSEMYIYMNFLKKIGFKFEYNLKSYYKSLKERTIIIDKNTIDLYWFKYHILDYEKYRILEEKIDFLDWLNIYTDFENLDFKELNKIEKKVFKMKLY
ncbi:WavE lipopolysaccharide synthesis family protein [Fusobacterium varium]|mgnify:CR=1 FL=1